MVLAQLRTEMSNFDSLSGFKFSQLEISSC